MDWENLFYALIAVIIIIGILWWVGLIRIDHVDYNTSLNIDNYIHEIHEDLSWNWNIQN